MALVRRQLEVDCVTAARERIERAFSSTVPVYLAMSGGKDSITLASLIFDLINEGRIDPKKLVVDFVDEEAIFDDVEQIVHDWRKKFMLAGAQFRWWAIPVKHFSCFNQLTSDESFICFEPGQEDKWVRQPPAFAIRSHPLLRAGIESYQQFMRRIESDGILLTGIRVAESVQRLYAISGAKTEMAIAPIFDWKDTDVWRYIRERNLDFPITYMYMYQLGSSRRDMRISQFFSIDTAKILVKMGEFHPALMDRVIKREPNAYLAAMYWDSELFRRSKKRETAPSEDPNVVQQNHKEKLLEFINNPSNYTGDVRVKNIKAAKQLLIRFGTNFSGPIWKRLYEAVLAGDPKQRTFRAIRLSLATNKWDEIVSDEEARAAG
jgi:predicted phosphoadenosine phosphosulfate sulfurtransferase